MLVITASLRAQQPGVISGAIYEDRASLALREHFVPVPGVTVKLFRDDGDGRPTQEDLLIGTATTGDAGVFVLGTRTDGEYWVAVDSTSFPGGGWPEQTMGPPGSLCARPAGNTVETIFEGPCFGGRTSASDDASSAATAEHIARVTPGATRADFAFSYDVVTTTADGAAVQGSIRRFIEHANARAGANRMRFVPVELPGESRSSVIGVPARWWRVTLRAPLQRLEDPDTTIDGSAWNFLSPASPSDTNQGRLGETATVVPDERAIKRIQRPELEIRFAATEGIVCESRCRLRAFATSGAPASIVTRADAMIEHVLIGTAADAVAVPERGTSGLEVERGVTVARLLLVNGQTQSGVIVAPGARLDADRIEVTNCGSLQSGAALVLLSDGSSIRNATIVANDGAGVLLGAPDGSAPAHGNVIDSCTIASNQAGIVVAPGSSRNTILRNDFMWNGVGGITVATAGDRVPRENRFSANRFAENGLRPIVFGPAAAALAPCERNSAAPNDGITPPVIESVTVTELDAELRARISGRACPGQVVEIYQSYAASAAGSDAGAAGGAEQQLPSVGEYNYLGATNAREDGSFSAVFPLPVITAFQERRDLDGGSGMRASEVLPPSVAAERAFSGVAIDAAGNTSEMSVRIRAGAEVD